MLSGSSDWASKLTPHLTHPTLYSACVSSKLHFRVPCSGRSPNLGLQPGGGGGGSSGWREALEPLSAKGTWGRSPGRADRVSAGPVVSNSEPLSPRGTPGLACGSAALLRWPNIINIAE